MDLDGPDRGLLKQLKKAYQKYIMGDVLAFDMELRTIALSFSQDPERFAKKMLEALR